jgi:Ca2+-binding RTX toxin-like protein
MKKLIRLKGSRGARVIASAVAVSVAIAVAAGIGAAQAHAASSVRAKLEHGALRITGGDASDKIALRLSAASSEVLEVDVGDDGSAEFSFERADITQIVVNGGDGDDLVRFDETSGAVNAGIATTLRGGEGDDTLSGGSGAETLRGGDGSDSIDGNRGADVGILGADDDLFVWDPGDGSDIVEGQDGHDTMLFNGAAGPAQFALSSNGDRLRFFRTQGAITMDTAGVERVDVTALGGADTVTVNDLTATDVSDVNVDLAETLGGIAGDGQPDRVVVNGTGVDDTIDVKGDAGGVQVTGLAATVGIRHSEAVNDRLEVNTLAGTDSVEFDGLAAGTIQLLVDGVLVP